MYEDKDQLGYAAMQEQLSGQIAMESLLSDYKSVCSEREEVSNHLYFFIFVFSSRLTDWTVNCTIK